MASSSWRVYTAPVGFDGEFRIRRRVRGVMADSTIAGVSRKPVRSSASTNFGTAPASFTISG